MRLKPFVETVFVSFRQLKVLKPPDLNPVERLWVGGLGLTRGDITAHLQGSGGVLVSSPVVAYSQVSMVTACYSRTRN